MTISTAMNTHWLLLWYKTLLLEYYSINYWEVVSCSVQLVEIICIITIDFTFYRKSIKWFGKHVSKKILIQCNSRTKIILVVIQIVDRKCITDFSLETLVKTSNLTVINLQLSVIKSMILPFQSRARIIEMSETLEKFSLICNLTFMTIDWIKLLFSFYFAFNTAISSWQAIWQILSWCHFLFLLIVIFCSQDFVTFRFFIVSFSITPFFKHSLVTIIYHLFFGLL